MNIIKKVKKTCPKMYYNYKELVKIFKYFICIISFLFYARPSFCQEERLSDNNTITWFSSSGTFKINPKVAIHTEYQARRVDGVKNRQQVLLRAGLNYDVSKEVSMIAGYAFAKTYDYGDFPVAFPFPEHRIYEQVLIKNQVSSIDLSHRFTLEQRFIGSVSNSGMIDNTTYSFLNRIRYRVRAEIPLHKKNTIKKPWKFIAQDEVFIGWGKRIGTNIFDQNRLGILIGYNLNKSIKFEAGYLSQILHQGKRVENKSVIQYNNGFMIAAHFIFFNNSNTP